jgi:hypothetical protein
MNRIQRTALGGLLAAVLAPSIFSQSAAVTGSASLGLLNRYIFRGYLLGRDSLIIQPSLSASYAGISASLWGNIDTSENATPCFYPDAPGRMSFNETDLTLSYAHNSGKFGWTAGFIYYGTRFTKETQEVYAGLNYDILGKPTLTVYRDISAYPGTYLNFSLSHSISLKNGFMLDMGVSLAYFAGSADYWRTYDSSSGTYTGKKYRAFHDGQIRASLTAPLGKGLSLQALVQYAFPLSSAAQRTINGYSYNINGHLGRVLVFGTMLAFSY